MGSTNSKGCLNPETTIVVATGNAHKLIEIEEILADVLPDTQFVALGQLGEFPEPEEIGTTFLENARIKARAAVAATGLAAIADDSGLVVDALQGAPGVYSARFAGVHGDDAANNALLLQKLAEVPQAARRARFASTVVLVFPDGRELVGSGTCAGSIGTELVGSHGFGYDPLFLPDATPGRTMAELAPEEKNAISHRFFALTALARAIAAEQSV
ncbi:RdgB/HAM1 family non-canonical purine NTP pyrophosphatase [Collinsella sp. AGMB00827]|uniref:dITP/XTP pyrophosphatase n=1 Tax=Collinsella ureilytica TaxID=2869515 RepID=A0ABS7MLZ5_9ACTN|nr:RdgB/HAM1 family non-canonical purine NTP pyrophosphatase [Collinsella urealyticum]MBY4797435.1 RdgB/HAM1 family non-canonical purine NTP pyrophosphatase [Collinsella urealyticum]